MSAPTAQMIFRQVTSTPGAGATLTHTIPAQRIVGKTRISVWVLSVGQPVTVNFRTTEGGVTGPQRGKTGGVTVAGEYWIDTTEDVQPGAFIVEVGGVGPASVKVIVMAV